MSTKTPQAIEYLSLPPRLTGQVCPASVEAGFHELLRELMTIVLARDVDSSVMLRFGELIRAGHDVGFAIEGD